jgi:gliotoxin/aspirochlorine biosynthesis thioredoxin reductase
VALIDVAVVGGGLAGLTAASTLARQLHTAVVFDSQVYRSAKSSGMHMVPGWENRDPKDFRVSARQDTISNYATIQFCDMAVAKIERRTTLTLLLSTGLVQSDEEIRLLSA